MHGQTTQGYDAEPVGWTWTIVHFCSIQSLDTPTKPQVSKRPVSKCSVSKRLKRQVYKMSGLQNVRFTKRQVFKTFDCKKTSIYILYLGLVEIRRFSFSHVCRKSDGHVLFSILESFFAIYHHNR